MKTITFYSYKGGVGRSLALSNMAIKLSQLKKKVFIIDFDLEAPGLQFKFEENYNLVKKSCQKGLVDYIYSFANENVLHNNIADFTCQLKAKSINDKDIDFLAAGNFESNDYWKKLATTKWSHLFYSQKSYGIRFFLDLKAKIEKEFNPDYLFIDSRTGITDISGITLKIFADEIVILAVNNSENLFGTKKIINSLTNEENELINHNPKIHFVLTRLPFPVEPEDKANEYSIIKNWENEIYEASNKRIKDISIIHTDKQINHKEIVKIGIPSKANTITYDYLKLFEKIVDLEYSKDLIGHFNVVKEAEELFNKALIEKDSLLKLELLDQAIKIDSSRYDYYKERGLVYYLSRNTEKAISDLTKALELKPNDELALLYLGNLYFNIKNYDKALNLLNQIEIDVEWKFLLQGMSHVTLKNDEKAEEIFTKGLSIYPESVDLLNARADFYNRSGKYTEALADVYKAIEISPDNGLLFATLAEISLSMNKIENFYLNLNLALSKGVNAQQLNNAQYVYKKVKNESRFLELLEKYQIKLGDIFK